MKRILCSLCIGSLALAVTAWGQEVSNTKAKSGRTTDVSESANTRTTARSTTHVSSRPVQTRTQNMAPRTGPSAVTYRNNVRRTERMTSRNVSTANRQRVSTNAQVRARSNLAVNRGRSMTSQNASTANRQVASANAQVRARSNLAVNRGRNATISRNVAVNRNLVARNRVSFAQAVRLHQRQWNDRGWWRSHFNTIVFVNGGWYFWDAGYWYPAWGYDPYAYYPYDGPIYAYNGLAPDQVVVDVQAQLQRDGYYSGPIDGVLGPMTRQAIANFQADHGLAVTSAVDEPTLATLGLA